MQRIDAHAHAFPDALAARAVAQVARQAGITPALDGTVAALLASMERNEVDATVICPIATRPEQFAGILKWARSLPSPRLIPLASVHPADPDPVGKVWQIAEAGLKGLKLHPYYQDFDLDEERLFPLYAAVAQAGLVLVSHTGFDVAFPRVRRAEPARVARVLERFPTLKFVATHLGAWQDWGEVRRRLIGRPLYIETSFALEYLPPAEARELLCSHPAERLLWGTDAPWQDQGVSRRLLEALQLDAALLVRIMGANAAALFERQTAG